MTISPSATFNASGGTLNLNPTSSYTYSCGNAVFNLVTLNANISSSSSNTTVNSDCNFPLGNNPNLSRPGNLLVFGTLSGTGTLSASNVNGSVRLNPGAVLSGFSGFDSRSLYVIGYTADFSGFTTFNLSVTVVVQNGGSLSLPSPTGAINITSLSVLDTSTFTAPSGIISISGDLDIDSTATFNQNNGTVNFTSTSSVDYFCGNAVFNVVNLNANASSSNANVIIRDDCTFPIGNNPNISRPGNYIIYGTLTG